MPQWQCISSFVFYIRSSYHYCKTVLSTIETAACLVRVYLGLEFNWRWTSRILTSVYYLRYFFSQAIQSCLGWWTYRGKEPLVFWMLNLPIRALTLWMLAISGIRRPSKIKFLGTFNARSHHTCLMALPVLLLPNSSNTKQVCSNLIYNVFPRIPTLKMLWFTISVRFIWPYSDSWSQYST